ncbi:MAG TPA: phosphate/phosphite/phosphonate ABC transporter substrate-binding protein [Gammaproteobacteria bacterium]|nr:phosphate/phosphite/phosphonate ABC transporter substrate-binding protein [Gammaproteobacteria bacterium]
MNSKAATTITISIYLLLNTFSWAAVNQTNETYRVGIVPRQSASKLAESWVPVLNYISQQSGYNLIFKTAKNIPTFEKQLAAGKYDFAYMNPWHFIQYNQTANYHALVKARNKHIKGIIVTRKGTPKHTLKDYNNQTLAFPSPTAFAASILIQAEFNQRHINIIPEYVSSHDSVYRNIAQGRYLAGGGVLHTFNSLDPDIKKQLEIIWTTRGYTPHAIAVHNNVPIEHARAIQKALIHLTDTDKGSALLAQIKLKGFDAAKDTDWNDVRDLSIKHIHKESN